MSHVIGRRRVLGLGGALATATVVGSSCDARAAPARDVLALRERPLFKLERSTNANWVQYAAQVKPGADGPVETALDPAGPVVAFWVMAQKHGEREPLGSAEQRAYGFRTQREGDGETWVLALRAATDRSLRVLRWGERWIAQVTLAGRSAVLERLWVEVDPGILLPSVKYIDLFGTDMRTRAPLRERLVP